MNNLGTVLLESSKLDEAEMLFRAALEQVNASATPDTDAQIGLMVNLADVNRARGDIDSAERMYLTVINSPDVSTSSLDSALVQLGEMLYFEGRYAPSIEHLRALFELRENYFGPLNRLTLSAIRKLTRAMNAAGRYEELIPLLKASLQRHTETEWEAAGTVCEARSLMANALIGLGRNDQAEEYMLATVELISRERGADHKYALKAKKQLEAFRNHYRN